MPGSVSRVFEIDAVLCGAAWIHSQRVDVCAVKRVAGKELILWTFVRRLRRQDRSAPGTDYIN
jgi:hypothetical protein